MSEASELIERMERETGQRFDDDDFDNVAVAGLLGSLARLLGTSQHAERDDVPAGVVIKHQISPEGQREQEANEFLAKMLSAGLSPNDIKSLTG